MGVLKVSPSNGVDWDTTNLIDAVNDVAYGNDFFVFSTGHEQQICDVFDLIINRWENSFNFHMNPSIFWSKWSIKRNVVYENSWW